MSGDANFGEGYKSILADTLLGAGALESRVLTFKEKPPQPKCSGDERLRTLYTAAGDGAVKTKSTRYIAASAEKILDAPNVRDDYYLNVLDWSCTNELAIGLGSAVYLWHAGSGTITELCGRETTPDDDSATVGSVSWTADGNYLAVGLFDGTVQLWDAGQRRLLRVLRGGGHGRVASMAWRSAALSAGHRDGTIAHHDVRVASSLCGSMRAHDAEAWGLRWNDDLTMLASGSNDNTACVWQAGHEVPTWRLTEHTAAVKALAWSPWQRDLLATGGGTADRTMKFWNCSTGALLNSVDTGSQVSQLLWSRHAGCREIVSGHGYAQNQLTVWRYPSLAKLANLVGHESR